MFPSRATTNSVDDCGVSDVAIAKRSESSGLTQAANSSPARIVIFTHSLDVSVRYDQISRQNQQEEIEELLDDSGTVPVWKEKTEIQRFIFLLDG